MQSLELSTRWPVDHAAAGVVVPDRSGPEPSPIDRSRFVVGDGGYPFRLASLTKPLVAWATLVAVEEGSVALDDPVGQPGCTLEHLLSHAGGYPLEGAQPSEEPGRSRIYSNTGFELIGRHLVDATDMPLDEYLRLGVLEPLGMHHTRLEGSPAHGATSTVHDLLSFLAELLDPTLITPTTAADAIRPHHPGLSGIVPGVGRFTPCPWALGFELAGDKHPHWTGRERSPRAFGHFGGAGTMMWVDPDARCGLVALTDRPFDQWAAEALRRWAELSDAVLTEVGQVARIAADRGAAPSDAPTRSPAG